MNALPRSILLAAIAMAATATAGQAAPAAAEVYPAAILPFAERGAGAKDLGPKITQVLFATLVADAGLALVDREEMEKTLQEQGLNLSGAVKPAEANQVGQLTGAKILVTGSVIQLDKSIMLVAKIIGTETSKVIGASVKGKMTDDLVPLAEQLAGKIAEAIRAKGDTLVAAKVEPADRLAALNKALGKEKRPSVMVLIGEGHVGVPVVVIVGDRQVGANTFDPAAETEMSALAKGAGFEVIDHEQGTEGKADVLIKGEAFSEFAGRVGPMVSVRARVEIKAVDRRSGKVLAVDRQTVRAVDLSEQVAGKSALQEAAADIAARLLPKLAQAKE